MKPTLLALDCTGDPCSLALIHAGTRRHRCSAPGTRQSERILVWVDELLAEAGLRGGEIDGLAVAIGPGGFTGVRLALATAQGLALAWQVPVLPVSSLAALALAAPVDPVPVLAVLDARMGELYAAWFQRGEDDALRALSAEQVLAPAQLVRPPGVEDYRLIGSGQSSHREAIAAALGPPAQALPALWPDAREVLALACQAWPHGTSDPAGLQPTYLRDKVALTSAEQAAARAAASA